MAEPARSGVDQDGDLPAAEPEGGGRVDVEDLVDPLNLEEVDPRCGALDYITGEGRVIETDVVMSNNFAFGGINTSLVFQRWS